MAVLRVLGIRGGQVREGGTAEVGQGPQTTSRRGRGAHRAAWWFGPLGGPPTSPLHLFIPRDVKTLKDRAFHPEHIRCRRRRQP